MNYLPGRGRLKTVAAIAAQTFLTAALAVAVTPTNSKTFAAGEKADVKGEIITRDGDVLKVRGADDSIGTVDLTGTTKIQLRKGFGRKDSQEASALVPGLYVEAKGKGNDKGDLVADSILFDRNSKRASRQIDARVSPLEARTSGVENRTGQLEGRAGQLESRAGQIEGRQTDLENTEKQTQAQVGQVKVTADQANQGVTTVNTRVNNLDNYTPKETATVYFKVNSATLTPQAKQDLDNLAQQAKSEKGYMIEIAGFADKTGPATLNQDLSQRRANAVIQYLEEQGDIPLHRILTPAGLGTSHEAADNKTTAGRKLNRRVEVKVLVNQGLVSTAENSMPSSGGSSSSGSSTPSSTSPTNSTQTGTQGQTPTTPPQQ